MKIMVEICESDIAAIIAEKFNIPVEDVFLGVRYQSVGYGLAENVKKVVFSRVFMEAFDRGDNA